MEQDTDLMHLSILEPDSYTSDSHTYILTIRQYTNNIRKKIGKQ
jgi:hypothetical protein